MRELMTKGDRCYADDDEVFEVSKGRQMFK